MRKIKACWDWDGKVWHYMECKEFTHIVNLYPGKGNPSVEFFTKSVCDKWNVDVSGIRKYGKANPPEELRCPECLKLLNS